MKNRKLAHSRNRFCSAISVAVASAALFASHSAQAANVTMTADDASGNSSFSGGPTYKWSDGGIAPHADDYFTETFLLRSPTATGNYTFGGSSLTLGGVAGSAAGRLVIKNNALGMTLNANYILNGGILDLNADPESTTATVAGTINVLGESIIAATNRTATDNELLIVTATINGSALLKVNGYFSGAGALVGTVRLNAVNPFSGTLRVMSPLSTFAHPINGALQLNNLNAAQNATVTLDTTTASGTAPAMSFLNTSNTGTYNIGALDNSSGYTPGLILNDTAGAAVALSVGSKSVNTAFRGALSGLGSITKVGSASTWTLSGANTYTGATTISEGTLSLTGSISGTSAITLSGTSIFSETATGVIGGAVAYTQNSSGASVFSGPNTYTGATIIRGGSLSVYGVNGTINQSTGITATGATLNFDNAAANVDRVKDAATVTLGGVNGGGTFKLNSVATAGATETIGVLTLDSGNSTVTLTGGTTGDAATATTTLAIAGALNRTNFATALVRATNFGSATTTLGRGMITLGTPPTGSALVGPTTAAGVGSDKTLKIIPFLVGGTNSTGAGTPSSIGSCWVTWDSTVGLRIVDASTEVVSPAVGYTTPTLHQNLRIGSTGITITNASGIAVNSLILSPASADAPFNSTNSNPLTIDSGAVLNAPNPGYVCSIGSGFSKLNLDNSEGVVTVVSNTLTINTPIDVTQGGVHAANGGLTKAGAGTPRARRQQSLHRPNHDQPGHLGGEQQLGHFLCRRLHGLHPAGCRAQPAQCGDRHRRQPRARRRRPT